MSKQFIKLAEEEELYNAIYNHMVELERPKYDPQMSLQDYGAKCVAYDDMKKSVKSRLDDMLRIGQECKADVI